jgi:integrase
MKNVRQRMIEAANLRIDDIDGTRMVVWARNTKGHRDRSMRITPVVTAVVRSATRATPRHGSRRGSTGDVIFRS